jgi:copper(I)-binding protein
MRMRPLQRIEIGPGAKAVLQPGGVHIMILGLAAPFKEGDRVPMTLRFERAGTIEVELQVESPRAAPPAHDH